MSGILLWVKLSFKRHITISIRRQTHTQKHTGGLLLCALCQTNDFLLLCFSLSIFDTLEILVCCFNKRFFFCQQWEKELVDLQMWSQNAFWSCSYLCHWGSSWWYMSVPSVCVSALPCSLDGGYHIHMHNAVFVLQSFGRCIVLMQQTLIMFNFCVNKVSGFVSNNRRSVQCYSEIRENGVWWGLKSCVFLNGMEEGQYIRRALTKLSDGGFRYGMRQPIIQREDHKVCPARQSAECGTIITFWQNLPFFLKE